MTSHMFYEGFIYHKRFFPKEHSFKYKFFMLDIDVFDLDSLKNKYFSNKGFNLFSFSSKDHFGKNDLFIQNIEELLIKFNIPKSNKMRFITLPRILNFVFNPISVLLVFDEDDKHPIYMLAEVHNYNGGRVIYPIKLNHKEQNFYRGEVIKDMYVSPFLKRDGKYNFVFRYDKSNVALKIDLFEDEQKKLTASFSGSPMSFNSSNVKKLFLRHTFLTLFVVIRTMWQSLKLYLKGLKFNSISQEKDTIKRF